MARLQLTRTIHGTDQPPILIAAQQWQRKYVFHQMVGFFQFLVVDPQNWPFSMNNSSQKSDNRRRTFSKQASAAIRRAPRRLNSLQPNCSGCFCYSHPISEVPESGTTSWKSGRGPGKSWTAHILSSSYLTTVLEVPGRPLTNAVTSELAFAIRVAQSWKQVQEDRKSNLIEDPWAFGNWLDGISDAANRISDT